MATRDAQMVRRIMDDWPLSALWQLTLATTLVRALSWPARLARRCGFRPPH